MELNLKNLTYDAIWYDHTNVPDWPYEQDVRLKIKTYPLSRSNITWRNGAMIMDGGNQLQAFLESLVDFEGIVDAAGPLQCTEEVKRKIYDFRQGRPVSISSVVLAIAQGLRERVEDAEKN